MDSVGSRNKVSDYIHAVGCALFFFFFLLQMATNLRPRSKQNHHNTSLWYTCRFPSLIDLRQANQINNNDCLPNQSRMGGLFACVRLKMVVLPLLRFYFFFLHLWRALWLTTASVYDNRWQLNKQQILFSSASIFVVIIFMFALIYEKAVIMIRFIFSSLKSLGVRSLLRGNAIMKFNSILIQISLVIANKIKQTNFYFDLYTNFIGLGLYGL